MRILNRIDNILLCVSGIAILLMMGMIVLEVILRSFFSFSIPGNYEFTQNYFMPLVIFPVLAYTYSSGIIPKINTFVSKLKSITLQRTIQVGLIILEIATFLLLSYFTLLYAISAVSDGSGFTAGGTVFPLYHALFLVPIGFTLMAIKASFLLGKMFKDKSFIPFQ